jgi:hypothetical protein
MGVPPGCSPAPARVFTPGVETGAGHIALPLIGFTAGAIRCPRGLYRGRGIEALQRAAQATKPEIRLAFEDVASGWFVLAEQVDWLDRRHRTIPESFLLRADEVTE